MNTAQKLVWTAFIIGFFVLTAIDHYDYGDGEFVLGYLFLGWIPALIMHKIWRDKK